MKTTNHSYCFETEEFRVIDHKNWHFLRQVYDLVEIAHATRDAADLNWFVGQYCWLTIQDESCNQWSNIVAMMYDSVEDGLSFSEYLYDRHSYHVIDLIFHLN